MNKNSFNTSERYAAPEIIVVELGVQTTLLSGSIIVTPNTINDSAWADEVDD